MWIGIRTHTSRMSETWNGIVNANNCVEVANTLAYHGVLDCSCENDFGLSRDPRYDLCRLRCDPLSHVCKSPHPAKRKPSLNFM